ncbi:peptidoglycan-binding protein [Streptomyces wuyuanensis]|uniref:peptidoglycan-binding protein n=1 Tax=Streptomyces wuyuanensis TaxID=1196353 RepID=UPI003437BBA4
MNCPHVTQHAPKGLMHSMADWRKRLWQAPSPLSDSSVTAFPGDRYFRPGARNTFVTCLRSMLIGRGARRYYVTSACSCWSMEDARACAAFQRAQGWCVPTGEGRMDPLTWQLLVNGEGHDIPRASEPCAPQPFPGSDRP